MALSKIGSDGLSANAAASNLGDYVTTVNGSTGAVTVATSAQGALADSSVQPGDNVSDLTNDSGYLTSSTGVTSVNSTTGAVTVQPTLVSGTNIKTINGASILGAGDITAGTGNMSVDTNTSSSTTSYEIGTYILMASNQVDAQAVNATRTPQYFSTSTYRTIFQDASNIYSSGSSLSGTWRSRGCIGFYSINGNRFDISSTASGGPWYGNASGNVYLMQRVA